MRSLIGNSIAHIDQDAFRGLYNLQLLILQVNSLTEFPTEPLRLVSHSLKSILLDDNALSNLTDDALITIPDIHHLSLDSNHLSQVPEGALQATSKLQYLSLANNNIRQLRPYAFISNPRLETLNLAKNKISYIPDHAFFGLRQLAELHLNNNPIRGVGTKAFTNLSALTVLAISDAKNLQEFPDLNGTFNLQEITLNRCNIRHLPEDLCTHMKSLRKIDFHSNQISMIPDLSGCTQLGMIDLKVNQITSLRGQPFFSLFHLLDLTLKSNLIQAIPQDAFLGLENLNYLDLSDNRITAIHPQAFVSVGKLEHLNLVSNMFPTLPHEGLTSLITLQTTENKYLLDIPPPDSLPRIQHIVTSYGYHCCLYLGLDRVERPPMTETITWSSRSHFPGSDHFSDDDNSSWFSSVAMMETPSVRRSSHYDNSDYWQSSLDIPDSYYMHDAGSAVFIQPSYNISCKPLPGPFLPCKDLFGSWFLRVSVWFVFLLAIIGNATVIIVIFLSHSKMDVPRFLICNLASADFAMGLYLSILASKDAASLGVFRQSAVQWQLGNGCRVAGFLAVFSSELSIYTLTTITLERFYAIKHAMHLEKRLKLRRAIIIMAIGWIFAITIATLPLLKYGINHYRYAVCLPVKVDDTKSLIYVATIMISNGLAFVIILLCYTSIYCSIQGSHAWNSNDSRVARRMSLLVFTDFVCWAPFAIFALASAFGKDLIPLAGSKVLIVFVLPVNSCANPFLYTLLTKQFKKDCRTIWRRFATHTVLRRRSLRSAATISLGRQLQASNTMQTVRTPFQQTSVSQEGILGDYNGVVGGDRTTTNEILETSTTIPGNSVVHRPSFQYQLSSDSFGNMLSPDMSISDQDQSRRGSGSPLIDRLRNGKPCSPKKVQTGWTRFSLRRKLPFLRRSERGKDVSMTVANHDRTNYLQNHTRRKSSVDVIKQKRLDDLIERSQEVSPGPSPLRGQEFFTSPNMNENNDNTDSFNDASSYHTAFCESPARTATNTKLSFSRRSTVEEAEMCQLMESKSSQRSSCTPHINNEPDESSKFIKSFCTEELQNVDLGDDLGEDIVTKSNDEDINLTGGTQSSDTANLRHWHQPNQGPIPSITIEHLSPAHSQRVLNQSNVLDEDLTKDKQEPMLQILGAFETRHIGPKESTV
ncbi:lutropin-choriogonadotropic hormone receptor-like [Lytechinus pictus]|uniref:lutropin-choriogonadotropic hormone receptor-like n=1 Tax=Lytechinus pictus TaxID=7653 RepID=UPI0030BA111C